MLVFLNKKTHLLPRGRWNLTSLSRMARPRAKTYYGFLKATNNVILIYFKV